jgi:AcrR family transcriptional regulator
MTPAIEWTPKARAVLGAASRLFYERGIHAVGVEAIAEHAGVTKKTIYDRFGSKERLVVEYLTARDRDWREFLAEHTRDKHEEPAAHLRAVFEASAAWAADRGGKGCSMINAHAEISDPRHPAYAVIVGQKRWMLELFTEIATRAGAPEPAAVGDQIMLLHEGAIVSDGMHVLDPAFTRAAETAVSLLPAR